MKGWLRIGATLVVAAGLAWAVVVHGLAASAIGAGDAQTALRFRPHSAEALSLAAEQALAKQDVANADRYARAALVQMPRDVRALRVLGVASSLQGHPRLGSELLLRAGSLSWRDELSQAWLIRAALDQRNYATAAQRIDAMLRGGQLFGQMLRLAHDVATIPDARAALIERLGEDPPWRESFFRNMESMPAGAEVGHALLIEALRAHDGQLTRREVVAFVNHLTDHANYPLARQVWLRTLEGEARGDVATVFDGNFRQDAGAEADQPRYAFEWTLESGHGAMASVGTPPMLVGETALDVRAGEAEQVLARQVILLAPGPHTLSYDTAVGDGLSPQGFTWRLACVGGSGLRVAAGPSRTVGTWRTATLRFDVPHGCGAQRIELVALASGDGSAEAWFDHVSAQ
ncbi:MAG: hypothetical protein V4574_17100 [Pseudomonadota bacterium]